MILLAQAQTFILQLVHHPVEYIDHTVGFKLPHLCEPAAEILLTQQVHAIAYQFQRLHYLPVEYQPEYQQEGYDSLHQIEMQRIAATVETNQHDGQTYKQQCQYEGIIFDAHDNNAL